MGEKTILISEDLLKELDNLKASTYRYKTIDEIAELMIWRGLKRTEVLIQERRGTWNDTEQTEKE